MYNRGDYIIFSMKGRIADTIHDPAYGPCYIVECENPTNSVIRIPVGSVDVKFEPTSRRHRAPSVEDGGYAGFVGYPDHRRPPSPNLSYINGVPQPPRTRWGGLND